MTGRTDGGGRAVYSGKYRRTPPYTVPPGGGQRRSRRGRDPRAPGPRAFRRGPRPRQLAPGAGGARASEAQPRRGPPGGTRRGWRDQDGRHGRSGPRANTCSPQRPAGRDERQRGPGGGLAAPQRRAAAKPGGTGRTRPRGAAPNPTRRRRPPRRRGQHPRARPDKPTGFNCRRIPFSSRAQRPDRPEHGTGHPGRRRGRVRPGWRHGRPTCTTGTAADTMRTARAYHPRRLMPGLEPL